MPTGQRIVKRFPNFAISAHNNSRNNLEPLLRKAAGRHPIYTTSDDEVSPAEAARMLGVSRQYVDRLIADGRLPFGNKPGSTHRTILVADVERLASQRSRRRANSDTAINALLDGGLDY